MKIYFEDGPLTSSQSLKLNCDHIVNASTGYSNNEQTLDNLSEVKPDASIYTNSLVGLLKAQKYCWNKTDEIFDLYLRRGENFVRVDELTDKELRFPHSMYCLWVNGAFKEVSE